MWDCGYLVPILTLSFVFVVTVNSQKCLTPLVIIMPTKFYRGILHIARYAYSISCNMYINMHLIIQVDNND